MKITLKSNKWCGTVTDVPLIIKSDAYFIKHKRADYLKQKSKQKLRYKNMPSRFNKWSNDTKLLVTV